MAKKPTPALAPHPHKGQYRGKFGGHFVVPEASRFALHRANEHGQPLDPDSPLHSDVAAFERALTFETFIKQP